jgi:hypothetical protein
MAFPSNAIVDSRANIGTLWTMRQSAHVARCVVFASIGDWELCVVVDGVKQQMQRCTRGTQAFALADGWKQRMLDEGWQQILPASPPVRGNSMPSGE